MEGAGVTQQAATHTHTHIKGMHAQRKTSAESMQRKCIDKQQRREGDTLALERVYCILSEEVTFKERELRKHNGSPRQRKEPTV